MRQRNAVIACASLVIGAVITRGCAVGRIGCGLCATVCLKKLIKDSNVGKLQEVKA